MIITWPRATRTHDHVSETTVLTVVTVPGVHGAVNGDTTGTATITDRNVTARESFERCS